VHTWPAARSGANSPDQRSHGSTPRIRVKPGPFVKETPGFLNIASRSFHLEKPFHFIPEFYI
jgi:hypothetical protein